MPQTVPDETELETLRRENAAQRKLIEQMTQSTQDANKLLRETIWNLQSTTETLEEMKRHVQELKEKLRMMQAKKESTVELIPIDQPLQVFSGSALHSSHTADHKKDVKPIFLKSVFEDSKESILLGIKKEEENEVKVVKMEQASDHHMSSRSMEIRQLEVSSLGNSNGPLFQSPRLQLEPSESGPSGHLTPEPSNQQSSDQTDDIIDNNRNIHVDLLATRELPSERPRKRQRVIVEVVLPARRPRRVTKSSAAAPQRTATKVATIKAEPDEEAVSSLAALKSTKYKIKKGLELSDVTVYERLKRIGLDIFTVPPEQEILPVPRAFMANVYGGSSQTTFPTIGASRLARYGFDNFVYLPLEYHPYAPQKPGAPGLYFSPNLRYVSNETCRCFVRVKLTPAVWLYCGQYQLIPSEHLGTQEWCTQSDLTRDTWVKKLHTEDWGKSLRSRIAFRKLKKKEPSENEAEKYQNLVVSAQEIHAAFEKGEEKIYVWALKCRSYDALFAQHVSDQYAVWRGKN